jgi:hypothetical protein
MMTREWTGSWLERRVHLPGKRAGVGVETNNKARKKAVIVSQRIFIIESLPPVTIGIETARGEKFLRL